MSGFLLKTGAIRELKGVEHHTEKSCWVCCKAFNKRVGYSKEDVKALIKKYQNVKEVKKPKRQKEVKKTKKPRKAKNLNLNLSLRIANKKDF